jgi:hypothetical protein
MIAALAERHEETRGICRVKRDREWYAWRYQTESDRNYRWIAAYAGAELRASASGVLIRRTAALIYAN